ncbi:hypothetical protein MUK42_33172 [Musa troglodytarum]|uniref:Uncharacterized protein n=1 Tax=Musa troglodytarum TaxID=320322 RepID=A0A9E7L9J9_9LILI|nr:hypothetical protein MUK42_33172 [Musa troglodytarum]
MLKFQLPSVKVDDEDDEQWDENKCEDDGTKGSIVAPSAHGKRDEFCLGLIGNISQKMHLVCWKIVPRVVVGLDIDWHRFAYESESKS